jgi:diaminopimelate epimerase
MTIIPETARRIPFFKLEGTGNDFVLLDFRREGKNFSQKAELFDLTSKLKSLAHQMADRRFGIGADQIIVLSQDAPSITTVDLRVQFFNADGTEAEICGNGLRALGVYLEHLQPEKKAYSIQTLSGEQSLIQKEKGWTVRMGVPKIFSPDEKVTALEKVFTFRRVSIGNPHAVIFGYWPSSAELRAYGAVIENDSLFPERTNVEFVEVVSPEYIRVKVWERGAGVTLSCGSGACAVVAAGIQQGILSREVSVEMPGGVLSVSWASSGESVELTGPAKMVFEGEFLDSP